jgi:2-polyprenyl-3-methyl-5-hydroxy-6-metoxy-1,4-benzoquinol methylase
MSTAEVSRRPTRGEEESLSRYYAAHQRYQAMRELLRYEDSKLLAWIAPTGKRVLELGCGSLPLLLAVPEPDFSYVGTDLSENGVRLAKKLVPKGEFLLSDAKAPGLSPGQFDVVVMKNLLHHVDRPADCLRAVKPLLAPGGSVLVVEPNSRCVAANLLKGLLGLAGRPLEESPYGQLKVGRLREAFLATGFEIERVYHSGLLAFPLSGDYGSLKVMPMWVSLWRVIIAVDRLLSIPLLGLGWLAPRLGFKVIFHLRPRDHKR